MKNRKYSIQQVENILGLKPEQFPVKTWYSVSDFISGNCVILNKDEILELSLSKQKNPLTVTFLNGHKETKLITFEPLIGTEKQIKWAEHIRKTLLAFVKQHYEAIAAQMQKNIADKLENELQSITITNETVREQKIKRELSLAYHEAYWQTIPFLLFHIAECRSAKVWIERLRDVNTVEAASRLIAECKFNRAPRRPWKDDDTIVRMEMAKERMRCPGCY